MDTIDDIVARVDDLLATAIPSPIADSLERVSLDTEKVTELVAILLDTYDKFAPVEYPQVQTWLADPEYSNKMDRALLANVPDEALIPLLVMRYLMSDKRGTFPPTDVLRFKELTEYCAPMLQQG